MQNFKVRLETRSAREKKKTNTFPYYPLVFVLIIFDIPP